MDSFIKVAHFSSGHEGGAGLAARRLNLALNVCGVDSKFFAISTKKYRTELYEYQIPRNRFQKSLSRSITYLQQNLKTKYFFSLMSFSLLNVRFIKSQKLNTSTILHFHNWYNLISQKNILKLANSGFKVVLTMHDERFYTGGCHYSFDCNGFQKDCANCPELTYLLSKIPKKNLQRITVESRKTKPKIHLIAPSMWIKERAIKSKLLRDFDIKFIPNTVGPKLEANCQNKSFTYSNLITIGIASFDIHAYIKGFDTIRELEDLISQKYQEFRIIYLKNIEEEKFEEKFWHKIDFLLVPSKVDNSPNVIHEAKMYGVPVIATITGGITELLNFQYDIPISVDKLSGNEIISRIRNWIQLTPEAIKKNRELMQSQFRSYSGDSVVAHINYYKEIINNDVQ